MTLAIPMVDIPSGATRLLGSLSAKGQPLPLQRVDLRARVIDRVAEVNVEQKFGNPFSDPIEAVYVFPLAGGSAVSRFEMQIGQRVGPRRLAYLPAAAGEGVRSEGLARYGGGSVRRFLRPGLLAARRADVVRAGVGQGLAVERAGAPRPGLRAPLAPRRRAGEVAGPRARGIRPALRAAAGARRLSRRRPRRGLRGRPLRVDAGAEDGLGVAGLRASAPNARSSRPIRGTGLRRSRRMDARRLPAGGRRRHRAR